MARLPIPGQDNGTWGSVLNDFLSQSLDSDGALKPSIVGTSNLKSDAVDSSVIADGALTQAKVQNLTTDLATKALAATTISAGSGLTGGGDLSSNRTLAVSFGATAGTAAQGNDARIAGAIQSTLADAKGDIFVASAADTVTRLPVGVNNQVLTADSAQATGVKWSDAAAGGASKATYPISAYGLVAASDDIAAHTIGTAFGSGVLRIFVPAGNAITAVGVFIRNVGTLGAGGLNGFAIYDDNGTFVESTASDDTLYTTLGWRFLTLNSVIPAQGTDRFVRVYRAVNGYSGLPNTFYVQIGTGSNTPLLGGYNVPNHRRTVYTNGEVSWPASFNPLTFGTLTEYVPLIGLG